MTGDPAARLVADEDLRTLPKVELHVHLEGSIDTSTAAELARRHGEDPALVLPLEDGRYPHRFRDFLHFVEVYLAVTRQVRTPADLAHVAAAFAVGQAQQRVRYTEVTFTAKTLVDNGMDPAAMWAALREGLSAGGRDAEVRLIVDAVRNLGPGHGAATVRLIEDADAPIAGIGLAGDETAVPARAFAMLREAADRLDLGLTVHAGETGPPGNVREALDDLGADRIGHGIAAASDDELIERLAAERTPLEVCPSSNVRLGVVASLEEHPFARLWRAGVNVTVNSDDPSFFDTTVTGELGHAARLAGLTVADVAELQRRAARAAFVGESRRAALIAEIDAWEQSRPSLP